MKKIKNIVKMLCVQPVFAVPLLFLTRLAGLKNYRDAILKLRAEHKYFRSVNFNRTVVRGPFKGLRYPGLTATGSVLAPKLLGSYESELFPAIEKICKRNYDEILDIGCAEGYYAIGLALKFPKATMHAFDTDKNAVKLCGEMAQENGVADRVLLKGFCSPETLAGFNFGKRGLIICDCEGYEATLFSEKNIHNLANTDLLIELHDASADPVSPRLLPLFGQTHDLEIIQTQKRDSSAFPELTPFSETDRQIILSELRGKLFEETKMEWAFLTAKNT